MLPGLLYPAGCLVSKISKLSRQCNLLGSDTSCQLILDNLYEKCRCCLADDVLEDALDANVARLENT